MTEEIRPARRPRRRAPEVRCRTAAPAAGSPAPAEAPAARDSGAGGELGLGVTRVRGGAAVVAVTGELDLRTADALRARLVEVHASGPRRLVADFAGVPFCDAAGLGALVAARNQIAASGGEIVLAGVRPAQLRLLRITGLHRLFAVHADVGGALAALDSPTTSG
ncbi:anti-sigma factor antagonist [Actinomadura sp. 7K507]|nr:anti-sigma factor antagonist [Actinomadura sp. 7K507]